MVAWMRMRIRSSRHDVYSLGMFSFDRNGQPVNIGSNKATEKVFNMLSMLASASKAKTFSTASLLSTPCALQLTEGIWKTCFGHPMNTFDRPRQIVPILKPKLIHSNIEYWKWFHVSPSSTYIFIPASPELWTSLTTCPPFPSHKRLTFFSHILATQLPPFAISTCTSTASNDRSKVKRKQPRKSLIFV